MRGRSAGVVVAAVEVVQMAEAGGNLAVVQTS